MSRFFSSSRRYARIPAGKGARLGARGYVPTASARARGLGIAAEIRAAGRPPRALACSNDQMALGFMEVLRARGIRVPEDTIVTGFDGIEEGRMSAP